MKFSMMILATALLFAAACSSPQEKYDDQRMEAKEEYNDEVKQAEEEFQEDGSDQRKDRAKTMIDNSDDVEVDVEEEKIDLE